MNALAAMTLLAVVTQPTANMHSSPSQTADVVSQAILGTNVELVEQRRDWLQIRTPDRYTGWMASASLRLLKGGESYPAKGKVAQVESLFAISLLHRNLCREIPESWRPGLYIIE